MFWALAILGGKKRKFETTVLSSFYEGNLTHINLFDMKLLLFHFPANTVPQVPHKLPSLGSIYNREKWHIVEFSTSPLKWSISVPRQKDRSISDHRSNWSQISKVCVTKGEGARRVRFNQYIISKGDQIYFELAHSKSYW